MKASDLKSEADFQEATTTREYIKQALDETFGGKADLTEHVLIFAVANNDGIRAKRGAKRKELITDEVDKFSHGFFGNSNNKEYFLQPDRPEDGSKSDPKPVISGCDAHSFDDLDAWLGKVVLKEGVRQKESTWIKADLTYEGLRQIIFEPADRVFIGEEPEVEVRVRQNPRRYIKAIWIGQGAGYDGRHGGWFKDEAIGLNKELVAIIGNKGNGKSALTDIIGMLGNSHNQKYEREGRTEELFSFLNRDKFLRAGCASNFVGELRWYAGGADQAALDRQTDTNVPEKVEYLPQKYLEKICTNIEDDEFRHKLNQVIFEYVGNDKRYGTTTLEDLITYLTNQTSADITAAKAVLHDANLKVVSLEKRLVPDYKKELEQKLKLKEADIAAHVAARPPAVSKPTEGGDDAARSAVEIKEIDDAIDKLGQQIHDSEAESTTLTLVAENLRQARQAIERQVSVLTGLKARYEKLLTAEGITFGDLVEVKVSYAKLDEAIQTKEARLRVLAELLTDDAHIEALRLGPDKAKVAREKSFSCQRTALEDRRKEITDKLDKPNRDYQTYLIAELSGKRERTRLRAMPTVQRSTR